MPGPHVERSEAETSAGAGPFILPYAGAVPHFATSPAYCGPGAAVLGRATLGARACLGARSVIRADGHFVRAGDDFSLGDRATVHIAHDVYPAIAGDRVTIGQNAVVHACTLGSDIVVEDNAVILDGSVVADGVVIEANSIVFPRSALEAGKLYAGMPAKPVRDLRPGELEERAARIARGSARPRPRRPPPATARSAAPCSSSRRRRSCPAASSAAEKSSIWFGCELDAGDGVIEIGENTNIQDNSIIRCRPGRNFVIGAGSTIGHNVTLGDCRIGARSLIGIGSIVANGTIVGDDVFLAAGAQTTEGQVLEAGWLYGKRPAQKMAPLDEAKRAMIARTVQNYSEYAAAFAAAQRALRIAA